VCRPKKSQIIVGRVPNLVGIAASCRGASRALKRRSAIESAAVCGKRGSVCFTKLFCR